MLTNSFWSTVLTTISSGAYWLTSNLNFNTLLSPSSYTERADKKKKQIFFIIIYKSFWGKKNCNVNFLMKNFDVRNVFKNFKIIIFKLAVWQGGTMAGQSNVCAFFGSKQ